METGTPKEMAAGNKEEAEQMILAQAGTSDAPVEPTEGGEFYSKHNKDGSETFYPNLATGAIVRRNDFVSPVWENESDWGDPSYATDPKSRIQKAMKYYNKDPVVSKSVDLLSALSNDTFRINAENKKVEDFFKAWWKDVAGTEFQRWYFLEYFRSGNVPIFKTLVPYRPKLHGKLGQTTGSVKSGRLASESIKARNEYMEAWRFLHGARKKFAAGDIDKKTVKEVEKVYAERKYRWSKRSIPGAYTVLNPLSITIKGPSTFPWGRQMYLQVQDDFKNLVERPNAETKPLIDAIPREILSQILDGKTEILLPEELASMCTRSKQPYEKWADPITAHGFEALDYKYELIQMDRATVRSVRNRILKVTVGNDEFPVFDPTEIAKLAAEFNKPSRTLTIFWNHTLQMEFVEPELESLNNDKFEPVNEDIRTCFGIAKILTGSSGESIGNNVLNLKGLVEILCDAQDSFIEWFNKEVKQICKALDIEEMPEGSFARLNMKDENEFMRVVAQLVEKQIISYETAMETIGYQFPREVKRLKSEQSLRDKFKILIPQVAEKKEDRESSTPKSGTPGRPPGKKEPGRPKRQGKPRSPNGLKLVANLPKYEEIKGVASEMFEAAFAQAEGVARSEGKRMTKRKKDETYSKCWLSVSKSLLEKYHIDDDPEEFLYYVVAKASTIRQEDQELNEVVPTVLGCEIAAELEENQGD